MKSTTIAIDLAKSVFQVSTADGSRRIIKRQRLSRSQFEKMISTTPAAQLVMEGCASAHHWGRVAQRHGHQVKLLHPLYVRPYVRRNKTDAADADALVRASADPDLKPIAVKSEHQQALQSLHRIRAQWQRSRVARINEARSLLAEFGVVLSRGTREIGTRLHAAMDELPGFMQFTFAELIAEIGDTQQRLKRLDRLLLQLVENDADGQRIMSIDGIGVITASAALGRVSNIHAFKRGRAFASWVGLTPREFSSGNKRLLGRISRRGDPYLRTLLIHGARAALLAAKRARSRERALTELQQWALATEARIGHNKAAVALANKMARILWAVWTRHSSFNGDDAKQYH